MSKTIAQSIISDILTDISAEFGDGLDFDFDEVYARACPLFMDRVVRGRMLKVLLSMGLPAVDFNILQKKLNKVAHEAIDNRNENERTI